MQAGWRLIVTNGGHLKWAAPNGEVVFSSRTPSDRRAVMNLRADLRRRGLVL